MSFKLKNITRNIRKIKASHDRRAAEHRIKEREKIAQQIAIEKERVELASQRAKLAKLKQQSSSGSFAGGMTAMLGNISGLEGKKKKKQKDFNPYGGMY